MINHRRACCSGCWVQPRPHSPDQCLVHKPDEVKHGFKKCPPLFLFGALKLPSVLKYVIDVERDFNIVANMTQATLLAHELYLIEGTDIPVVTPTIEPNHTVDGVVIFGLEPEQRGWIHDFEHGSCTK